jgi:hypothetical protein
MNHPDILTNPEGIESEKFLLLAAQDFEAASLEAGGILDKARRYVPDERLNDLTRAMLALSRQTDADGEVSERVSLRFVTPGEAPEDVVVAVRSPFSLDSGDGFNLADATQVLEIADGFKAAASIGLLPHMTRDLTDINSLPV